MLLRCNTACIHLTSSVCFSCFFCVLRAVLTALFIIKLVICFYLYFFVLKNFCFFLISFLAMTKPYIHVTVRLPTRLLNSADEDAARRNLKRSEWLRIAIQNELEREQHRTFLNAQFEELTQHIEEAQIAIMRHVTGELEHRLQSDSADEEVG